MKISLLHKNMNRQKKNLFLLAFLLLVIGIMTRRPAQPISTPSPSLTPGLTAEEKFILNPPPKDASRSALEKHAQTVAKLAKEGDMIEINHCQPTPRVLKTKLGSSLTIKNDDNAVRMIIFDSQHIYKIPPKGHTTIMTELKYGTGDYGYVCSGAGIVGFLHIV